MATLRPRRVRTDLIALAALCAVVYALGLTVHGLTNWQEAQRALVAREMQAAGEWIVPLSAGEVYLSKPPLVYWITIGIAEVLGREAGLFELRLTVAVAGLLGVLATYLVARRVLFEPGSDGGGEGEAREGDRAWADHAAWWGALMLATGILYVRSSRVGELDILLVPPTVVGIGALHAAWRSHATRNRIAWGAVLLVILCAVLCALAKGPPGVLTLLLGGYGGVLLAEWRANRARPEGERRPAPVALLRALSRTHPLLAILLPVLALWLWSRAVAARVGAEAVRAAIAREAGQNLRVLDLDAPLHNLEALSYGVGLGSAAAIAAGVWLVKDRPRLPRGWLFVAAWIVLPVVAFSVLGKGVGRYLTPIWPAIAMLGGMWLASLVRDRSWGVHVRRLACAIVAILAVGQAWWYAYGREQMFPDRSPRAFLAELLRPEHAVQPQRLGALDFWTPALDYYAGAPVEPIADLGPRIEHAGRDATALAELAARLRETGATMTLLVRESPHPDTEAVDAIDRLHEAGFAVATIPVESQFVIDNRQTRVEAVRVWVP